jgi:hypothetical protein
MRGRARASASLLRQSLDSTPHQWPEQLVGQAVPITPQLYRRYKSYSSHSPTRRQNQSSVPDAWKYPKNCIPWSTSFCLPFCDLGRQVSGSNAPFNLPSPSPAPLLTWIQPGECLQHHTRRKRNSLQPGSVEEWSNPRRRGTSSSSGHATSTPSSRESPRPAPAQVYKQASKPSTAATSTYNRVTAFPTTPKKTPNYAPPPCKFAAAATAPTPSKSSPSFSPVDLTRGVCCRPPNYTSSPASPTPKQPRQPRSSPPSATAAVTTPLTSATASTAPATTSRQAATSCAVQIPAAGPLSTSTTCPR